MREAGDPKTKRAEFRSRQPKAPPLSLSGFEQAAERGDRESAMIAAQVCARRAETRESLGNWAEALEEWERTLHWVEAASKGGAIDKQLGKGRRAGMAAQMEALRRDALYGRAVGLYMLRRYEEVAVLLTEREESADEREQILLGLALARQAAGSWNGTAWHRVLASLGAVEPGRGYLPREVRNEQVFFAKGAAELAGLYRLGLPGILVRDVGHARQVLAAAAERVCLPDVKTWLDRELARYQKREGGGYGYQ